MTCKVVDLGDGNYATICSRGSDKVHRCESCGAIGAPLLCDYPVLRKGKAATCDRRQCEKCAVEVGPNEHHCAPHARMGPPKM